MKKSLPFLFGAQYYRAPTPEQSCWASDLAHMRDLGFNSVKFWVQWRWSHRRSDRYYWDDLDRLMDLAQRNQLRVTLNTILDVAPIWLYQDHPDAKQVMCDGTTVEPYTVGHRQIGGHPGPCYNHPGALAGRQRFMGMAIRHFRDHPALDMWDVWNEPELCFPQRTPDVDRMACYCRWCQLGLTEWLQAKYVDLDALNAVWGRCYDEWSQVEIPRNPHTITDYVDWREFHIDTMSAEAAWRLDMVGDLDPAHTRYLHVVPDTMAPFNAVTCCADDFVLADKCQVFAATMNGGPLMATQVVSAARGKTVYNVESHVNAGCTSLHQRQLALGDLLRDFLPQIGLGIRGFLFWQYRAEVLGFESPSWGLVHLDGTDRPVTAAAREFWAKLAPYADDLMDCAPTVAPVAIWKSRKNEIFHWCIHHSFDPLKESIDGYVRALYRMNLPYRFIDAAMLEKGELQDVKLLIMPSPYYLGDAEAKGLDQWVRSGGVLLSEAHLGGYSARLGRHSRRIPGCGLADAWGLVEVDGTSSYHLEFGSVDDYAGEATDDVVKALAYFGTSGGLYYPILMPNGHVIWGASRYAELESPAGRPEGSFDRQHACLMSFEHELGHVFYAGTNLGLGAKQDDVGLRAVLYRLAERSGILARLPVVPRPNGIAHCDAIGPSSEPRFLVVTNPDAAEDMDSFRFGGRWRGLYSGAEWCTDGGSVTVPGEFCDLFVPC